MIAFWVSFFIILAYVLGSIPSGLIVGKVFKNIDIRQHGSKNMGATNAIRVLGFKYGIIAFIFDVLKGAFVMAILNWFNLEQFYIYELFGYELDMLMLYGGVAVIGHVFPIYINFKGGKAVATSAGVVLALAPIIGVLGLLIFFVIFLKTRYVSISSTIAASSVLLLFVLRIFIDSRYDLPTHILNLVIITSLSILIFIRHKQNYRRLREGTENKFEIHKK